mgnify:CR=1 FL=1
MHKEIKKLNHFHYTNAGAYTAAYISAPGVGKRLLIWGGIAMDADALCTEYGGSAKIISIPSNSSVVLPAPLAMAENKGLQISTEDVQIFYTVENTLS